MRFRLSGQEQFWRGWERRREGMDYSGWPDEQRFIELDEEIQRLGRDPEDRPYRQLRRRKRSEATDAGEGGGAASDPQEGAPCDLGIPKS